MTIKTRDEAELQSTTSGAAEYCREQMDYAFADARQAAENDPQEHTRHLLRAEGYERTALLLEALARIEGFLELFAERMR